MKILHVTPTYLPAKRYGGPIYSVHGLCRALAKIGHQIDVFTTNVDGKGCSDVPTDQFTSMEGVNVCYFKSYPLRRIYYSKDMERAFRKSIAEYDLIHIHSIYLWPTVMAASIAFKRQIPYVISPRGMFDWRLIRRKSYLLKTLWIKVFGRRIIENAAAIHVTSEFELKKLKEFKFKLPQVCNIPNGINIDASPDKEMCRRGISWLGDDKNHKDYLLYLGRLSYKKGLERLLGSLRYIPNRMLLIAGNDDEGYTRKLECLIHKYDLQERVRLIGPVYGSDKWDLFKNALAFVLPSSSENFGIAVLEAMSVGCPVVVTPNVGLADEIARTGSGLVSEEQPEVLGSNIADLIEDKKKLEEMGQRGIALVKKRYAWPVVAKQMDAAYLSLKMNCNERNTPNAK